MTKAEIRALEKVFAAEVEARLPFQTKARIYRQLEERGYLKPYARRIGTGWLAVTVSGYALTHAGRIAYCETCRDVEEQT